MGLRLGIDLDGVVADFTGGWIDLYNKEFSTNIDVSQADTWSAPIGLTHFATMSEFWVWAKTCGEGRSLFRVLDPYPGALSGLDSLVKAGHDIVVITTKPRFAVQDTYDWLAENEVPAAEVHIIDDKAAVRCEVYVDDAEHNLVSYRRNRPLSTTIRWVQLWNEPLERVVDADTWQEVLDIVATHRST